MSMPTPQSLFVLLNLVSLFTSHMKGWISWDSITVAAIRCTFFSVIWIKLVSCLVMHPIHCDGIWWFSKLWTGSTETSSWGKEWNECVFTHLGPSEMNVNCSLIEVMGIFVFCIIKPSSMLSCRMQQNLFLHMKSSSLRWALMMPEISSYCHSHHGATNLLTAWNFLDP